MKQKKTVKVPTMGELIEQQKKLCEMVHQLAIQQSNLIDAHLKEVERELFKLPRPSVYVASNLLKEAQRPGMMN